MLFWSCVLKLLLNWIVYVAVRGDAMLVELYLKREKNVICLFSLAVTAIIFISEIILLWSLNLCSRFSSAILWFYSPNFLSSCNTTAVQRPLEIKLTNYKNNNKQKNWIFRRIFLGIFVVTSKVQIIKKSSGFHQQIFRFNFHRENFCNLIKPVS